jgi:hypothetical protein
MEDDRSSPELEEIAEVVVETKAAVQHQPGLAGQLDAAVELVERGEVLVFAERRDWDADQAGHKQDLQQIELYLVPFNIYWKGRNQSFSTALPI